MKSLYLLLASLAIIASESILEAQRNMVERDYILSNQMPLPTKVEKELEILRSSSNTKVFQFIQRSFASSQKKEETLQVYGFFYFLGFLCVYFLVLSMKNYIRTTLKMKLFRLINNILGDISIILFVGSFMLVLNYYEVLSFLDDYMYIDSLCMAITLFSVIWLAMGIYNILVSQTQARIWREYERQLPFRKTVKNDYENLHMLINQLRYYPNSRIDTVFTSQQLTEMKVKRDLLEYFLIRQEFISPSFQPTFKENFLREDFDFANYLIRCLGDLGKKVFKINGLSIIVLLILVLLRVLITLFDPENEYSFYVMTAIPLIVMIFLIVLCRKMIKNYRMVVQIVDNPVEVKFTEFEKNRDPMANFDRLKKPTYLNEPALAHSNKHESLFWLGRPDIGYQFIHIPLFIQIAWAVEMIYEFYTPQIYLYYLLMSLAVGFTFISIFILIPALIYYFTIVSNVQMLKKNETIEKVVFDQKRQKCHLIEKLAQNLADEARYQSNSSASFRESYIEKWQFDDIRETFRFHASIEEKKPELEEDEEEQNQNQNPELDVSIDQFVNVLKSLGCNLNYTALKILVKRCSSHQKVPFEQFVKFLKEKQSFFGVDMNEFFLVLFTEHFNNQAKKDNQHLIHEKRLRKVLKQNEFLSAEEINQFIEEVNYLHTEGVNIQIPLVVNYITDNTHSNPL